MSEQPILNDWRVPVSGGGELHIEARLGEVITVVGSNGSGKSALASWMAAQAAGGAELRRVLAQRKLWFEHAGPAISPADRQSYVSALASWDREASSRYIDRADGQRTSISLFDLLGKINHQSRRATELFYNGVTREVVEATIGERLLPALNLVLERAGLHVELGLTEQETFTANHRKLGVTYPISQMSDGERGALLLAADVLTAPGGAIVMIDEPERHLHRSISAGLVEAILEAREDCAFVVLTHDLDLAAKLGPRPGRTFSVLGVDWTESSVAQWRIHEVETGGDLSEAARQAILGGREQVLFIEGDKASIDLDLYSRLFPGWSLMPAGGCDLVIRSVTGLLGSTKHHWVKAAGVVDGDGRSEDERRSLESRGIHALPVSEVENLYYLADVLAAVAAKQAATLGKDQAELVEAARSTALGEIGRVGTLERLAKKLAKDALARKLVAHMPGEVGNEDVTITITSPLPSITRKLQAFHLAADYDGFVREIPLRDTAVPIQIAKQLGFRDAKDYQRAALVCITETAGLAAQLRKMIGVPEIASAAEGTAA